MMTPKIALITNIPSPYREGPHMSLHKRLGDNYHVFYCGKTEKNRHWEIDYGEYNMTFLKKAQLNLKTKTIYYNFDIIKNLNRYNPDVVITTGFYPTMLLAFLWCMIKHKKHLVLSDATLQSEAQLTFIHTLVRKILYHFTDSFIAVSNKGLDLYRSYHIKDLSLFLSPLCADNEYYKQFKNSPKKYDLMFCGQFIDRKMPFFYINVVKIVKEKIPCRVVLIGSGQLEKEIIARLNEYRISYDYPGFIQADVLPRYYASSKILLFPTVYDAWGLVANEACAVGVPVITCDNAGAANELIIHNRNGFVLPLDERIWADHIIKLLTDNDTYQTFSDKAYLSVQRYNFESAADGIINAANYSFQKA